MFFLFFFMFIILASMNITIKAEGAPTTKPPITIEERLRLMQPMQLVQFIEGSKTRAFSKDSLLYSGIDEEDIVKAWNPVLQKTRDLILEDPQAREVYSMHFARIQNTSQQVIAIIARHHPQFKPAFRDRTPEERTKTDSSKIFDPTLLVSVDPRSVVADLKEDILQLTLFISSMRNIFSFALQQITTSVPTPESWKRDLYNEGTIKNAKSFVPNYKKMLSNFQKAVEENTLDDFYKRYEIDNERNVIPLVSNLEKIIFIMHEKEKRARTTKLRKLAEKIGFNPAQTRRILIKNANDLYKRLMQKHQDILTDLVIRKLYVATDKAAVVAFAQAFNLRCVCGAVRKELEAVRQSIMNAHNLTDRVEVFNPLLLPRSAPITS